MKTVARVFELPQDPFPERKFTFTKKNLIAKSLCLGLFDYDCHQFLVLIALRFDEISSKLVLEEKKQTNTNLEQ